MGSLTRKLQPAVKKETMRVAGITAAGVVVMWIVFAVLHLGILGEVPFDYTVILGGLGGGIVAVLNFFLMALTVQKVAAQSDEELARTQMKASYSQRMMLQILWIVVAIAVPCFQFVAGIAPLLFPSLGIKAMALFKK